MTSISPKSENGANFQGVTWASWGREIYKSKQHINTRKTGKTETLNYQQDLLVSPMVWIH